MRRDLPCDLWVIDATGLGLETAASDPAGVNPWFEDFSEVLKPAHAKRFALDAFALDDRDELKRDSNLASAFSKGLRNVGMQAPQKPIRTSMVLKNTSDDIVYVTSSVTLFVK